MKAISDVGDRYELIEEVKWRNKSKSGELGQLFDGEGQELVLTFAEFVVLNELISHEAKDSE